MNVFKEDVAPSIGNRVAIVVHYKVTVRWASPEPDDKKILSYGKRASGVYVVRTGTNKKRRAGVGRSERFLWSCVVGVPTEI